MMDPQIVKVLLCQSIHHAVLTSKTINSVKVFSSLYSYFYANIKISHSEQLGIVNIGFIQPKRQEGYTDYLW